MKEVELAQAVIVLLEKTGWEVYQEVQINRGMHTADIIAVLNNKIVWVIECKQSYGLAVLEQASHWGAHYRSIAVPKLRKGFRDYTIAKEYFGVGVIECHKGYKGLIASEKAPAPLKRIYHNSAKFILSKLEPEHKTFAQAGTNTGKKWTPFQATMTKVREFVITNPGSTMKQIIEGIESHHYGSHSSARQSLAFALQNFESRDFEVDTSKKPYRYYRKEISCPENLK